MTDQVHGRRYGGNAAENYQRFFVPAIGGPVAEDLIEVAALRPGERVLDVACGTGVVTRMAAGKVGAAGAVAGLDVNPGMLAVARAETEADTPADAAIEWHEASAEAMPLPDDTFDVVLCQMGLQFMPEKSAALGEMRRVLKPGGRVHVTLPGPRPEIFRVMSEAVARHLGPELGPRAASFVDLVFSLHDAETLAGLMREAGFREVDVRARPKDLTLPAPRDFLWEYVYSTPLAAAVAEADRGTLDALEREVCTQWQDLAADGRLPLRVGMTTGSAVK